MNLVRIFNEVRFTGVGPIWEHIEARIRQQLLNEIGGLYRTKDGSISAAFETLIKKGPAIYLNNLNDIHKTIKESPWYLKLSETSQAGMFRPMGSASTESRPSVFLGSRL